MERLSKMTSDRRLTLSIVVAAFNEEGNLPTLHRRICELDWAAIGMEREIVYVDDHSDDGTASILAGLAAGDKRVKVLRFSRNFGSHKAFAAGLEHCTGDVAAVLAADLQDPPETVPLMLEKWRAGARVVWAERGKREGISAVDQALSRLYYALMRRFAEISPPKTGSDFALLDRMVIDQLKAVPEKHTALFSLIQWMGFEQDSITYVKAARLSGQSKWTLQKKIKLVLDSFVSFSYAPVRLASLCGIVFALSGFLYAGLIAGRAIVLGSPVPGWASLMCVLLIISGVQLVMLGILGEYLWRTFDEARGRPRYVVEKRINL